MPGINVAADGRHSAEWVAGVGADAVRIVLTREHDLRDRLREYRDHGLFVLGVCARESFDGFDSWDEAFTYYRRRYVNEGLIGALQVGNESDLDSPSSWTMSPDDLSSLGWAARSVLPDTTLVCAGMASGQPGWLEDVDLRWCNVLAVHPYAKDATPDNDLPDAWDLVHEYWRYGLPVWVSEWGWWGDEERGESETRDMVQWAVHGGMMERYFHFCADDAMVAPFGLYREDGSEKPAGLAFREAAGIAALVTPAPDTRLWDGKVGPGLLDAMGADGVLPAWPASRWEEYGEVCDSTGPSIYVWSNSAQLVMRVPKAAA